MTRHEVWPDPETSDRKIIMLMSKHLSDKEIAIQMRCTLGQLHARQTKMGITRVHELRTAITLRLANDTLKALGKAARKAGVSTNRMATNLIAKGLRPPKSNDNARRREASCQQGEPCDDPTKCPDPKGCGHVFE